MDRTYPARPWVGVGVVVVRDGKVLLVQRGGEPGRGLWAVPGGMVDLGETAREAAAREALEETGLRVEVGDVFWIADAIVHDPDGRVRYHNVIVDFLATAPAGEPSCADDALDVRWVGPDEWRDLPVTPTMRPLLEKLFGTGQARPRSPPLFPAGGGALQVAPTGVHPETPDAAAAPPSSVLRPALLVALLHLSEMAELEPTDIE